MTELALICKPLVEPTEILIQLQTGQLLKVNGSRGNAIIICHSHHAELAGPGAGVGGLFDADCTRVIPVGNISLVYPESRSERQKAYVLRQNWISFTQHAMNTYVPLQRAKLIFMLLHRYFDASIIQQLPDEVIAQLVGVLPRTIGMVRQAEKVQEKRSLEVEEFRRREMQKEEERRTVIR
ncbi:MULTISPECIES: hypothetical protein [unclassified Coleofasciculus]|uniref:hypothetical protein n=1 Tax=unclassified Coleofasciculus TaxID=2692782 RepID=UPI00188278B9|nr:MULTISPECIES: hypothetical protein [unclassified Coleofasciculus]MBE9127065.1 hypothetical protein [Coleofasciculus sp. LEGE 07081]MBE9150453.1 hypothetical protein [Coleofasciculus sp. LEGE 07092]